MKEVTLPATAQLLGWIIVVGALAPIPFFVVKVSHKTLLFFVFVTSTGVLPETDTSLTV